MEVMIVVAIMGIMTTIGLVSMSATRNKKNIEIEARRVVASIREAQNYALTGKIGGSGFIPCRFRWISSPVVGDNTSYWITTFRRVSASCDGTAEDTGDSVKYSLQNGVTFSNNTPYSIDFSVPFAGVSASRIVLAKGGNYYTVCVSSSGVANEFEGDVTCP